MKIFQNSVIHTFWTAENESPWHYIGQASEKVLKYYANTHKYGFFAHHQRYIPNLVHAWDKIPILLNSFKEHDADWHVIFDADIFILNFKHSLDDLLEHYIRRNPNRIILTGSDWKYPINAGVLVCHKSSQKILEAVNQLRGASPSGLYEQGCLQVLREASKEVEEQVCPVRHRILNSYSPHYKQEFLGGWRESDFLVHFAGWKAPNIIDFLGESLTNQYLSATAVSEGINDSLLSAQNEILKKRKLTKNHL